MTSNLTTLKNIYNKKYIRPTYRHTALSIMKKLTNFVKNTSAMIIFTRILVATAILVLYGWSVAIYGNTIANGYIILSSAAIAAAALWFPARKIWPRVLSTPKPAVCFIAHMVAATSITLFAILGSNYYCADPDTTHSVNAVVESRYSKERQRTRRIHRRVYYTGQTYRVYYMLLRFDNGRTKGRQISLRRYNSIRKGQVIKMPVSRGLLGMPVISTK